MQNESSRSASIGIVASKHPTARRFIALWALSFAVPCVLLTATRIAVFKFSPDDIAYYVAFFLLYPAWLSIAWLRFRLLRLYSVHRRFWLVATFLGGSIGGFVGGLVRMQTMDALEFYAYESALVSDYNRVVTSDWIFATAPALSITVGCLAGAAVLGFLQSFCLNRSFGLGLIWFLASIASAVVAGIAGSGGYSAYLWSMFNIYPRALSIGGPQTADLIALGVGLLAGLLVYGLLAGAALHRMLIHGVQRHNTIMVEQFD
jgi:hypothetical protein